MLFLLFSIFQTNHVQILPKHFLFKKMNGQIIDAYDEIDVAVSKSKEHYSREAFLNATQNTSSIDVDTLNALAQNNFGPALFLLGDMYLYGIEPISLDLTKAAHLYKEAAKKNITSAFTQLGFLYTYGLGVEKNIPKAVVYHRIGCERKSAYSCLWEAHAHRYGIYKPKSNNLALTKIYPIALFVNHLANKNAISHHMPEVITRRLKLKENKIRDDKGNLQIIQYKAELGDADAEMELARSYYYGNNGQEINIHKAREIFEKHLDNSDAIVHLGRIHHLGEDGPVDLDLAEHYYKMAADMGNVNAFNNLGVIHNERNDPVKALELLRKAADQNHPSAKFNLAMYEIRNNNSTYGLKMLRELVDSGMILASLNYATFERNGVAPFDEEDAFWLFHSISTIGPWREESQTAESYYKNGSYDAALLLWMQLSDQGQCQASFNAGLVLENWERIAKDQPFLVEGYDKFNDDFNGLKLRRKLSSRMLKNAINYCKDDDFSPYLYEIYMKRNMTRKAIEIIRKHGTSSESSFIKIKLMLEGMLPLKFMEIKKEFSIGLEKSNKSILAFLSLVPWIAFAFIKQSIKFIQNENITEEYAEDYLQFSMFMWHNLINPFEMLIIFNVIIILVKKRFETIYNG